ncbi:MAG: hypothetical protein JJU00_07820 [Opitutales bacterium]|nr:hypothetical protein [Opitutales bacterium]
MISAAKEPAAGLPVKTGAVGLDGNAEHGPFLRLGYRTDGPLSFEESADGSGTLWLPAESSLPAADPLFLAVPGAAFRQCGPFRVWANDDTLAGVGLVPASAESLARAAHDVYAHLFTVARGYNLCRIWNWVPDINECGPGDPPRENYREFCLGRSAAFAAAFGDEPERWMPAGTAVGLRGDTLAVLFTAVRAPVEHRENPRQVPAYRYPARYGPRPPSFARATMVRASAAEDCDCLLVSGTASIIASESRFPEDLAGQLRVTVENLRLMGVEGTSSAAEAARRHFRVYIRRWEDCAAVRSVLEDSLLRGKDRVVYVHADICRKELLVEVEATLFTPAGAL